LLLKFLATLLLFLVAALVFVGYLVDLNDYKDEIQDRFAAATGHELVISGPVRVDLFPEPVLEIMRASLPGALGIRGSALAEVDRVRLYSRWVPLLAGRLELVLVRVEGLRLYLIRDRQGRASWDVDRVPLAPSGAVGRIGFRRLAGPSQSPGPFDAWAAEAGPVTDWPPIGRIEILGAQVLWDDRRSGQRLELDGLEGRANPVVPARPIAWRVMGSVRTGDEDRRPAPLRAEGELRIGAGPQPTMRLEPLTMRVEGFDLGSGLATDLVLRAGIDANLDAGRYLTDQADLEIRAFGAALSTGRIKAKVGARLDLDLGTEHLKVTDLALRSGTLAVSGTALGERLLSAPVVTGDLKVAEFDLRAWLAQRGLPPPRTADPETFRRFALNASWRLEGGRLSLSDLVLGIDKTRFTGVVEQVSLGPPTSRFDLVANRLDLDSYLPPDLSPAEQVLAQPEKVSQQGAPVVASAATPVGPDEEATPVSAVSGETSVAAAPAPGTSSGVQDRKGSLPSATAPGPAGAPVTAGSTDNLDLEGRLRFGELKLARLRFGDADLKIGARDGKLDIDNRVRRFYEGRLVGRFQLDIKGTEPRVTLVQRAKGIQVGHLLADLPWNDRLSGRGEITADLIATGHSANALRRSLVGTLTIHFPQGVVRGFSLERLIREARARLRGKAPPKDLPMDTEFTDLRASAEVQNGVLRNRDFVATTEHLRITGAGTLDLVRGHVDYRFEFRFVEPPKGLGIKELERIPIPVHLTGPFDHPRWDLDLESALSTAVKRRLGEKGDDLFRALKESTEIKGLEQGLKGLFGR